MSEPVTVVVSRTIRPGHNHLIYQFGLQEHLQTWEHSRRAELIVEGDEHSIENRQVASGLETLPD